VLNPFRSDSHDHSNVRTLVHDPAKANLPAGVSIARMNLVGPDTLTGSAVASIWSKVPESGDHFAIETAAAA
jgi:hypothetical protein